VPELLPSARAWVTDVHPHARHLLRTEDWVVVLDPESPESLFDSPDRVWQGDLALVVGAEGAGLRHGIRRLADHRFAIPMQGRVGSLNVASAGALALFEAARRTRSPAHPRGNG